MGNESILDKTSSNYRINSDLNAFDIYLNKDKNKTHNKLILLENKNIKKKIKLI